MRIHVRYFAVVRERLGRSEEPLELDAGTTVEGAIRSLSDRHPVLAALVPHLRFAVNQDTVPGATPLHDGDELALIPPVAGGVDRLARIVAEGPLGLAAVTAEVQGPGMGGVVTFTGHVRDHSQGRAVQRLEYEAYPGMAERVFRELCAEIEREIPGCRLALEHRTGVLAVGDVAVVIAAAAPHRAEAFRACALLIDRLKERAPIWKKEVGPDGASWVGMGP